MKIKGVGCVVSASGRALIFLTLILTGGVPSLIGQSGTTPPPPLSADPLATWHSYTNLGMWVQSMVNGPGVLVAGDDYGNSYLTTDGASWTRYVSGLNYPFRSLAYGANRYVAAASSLGLATSDDGQHWRVTGPSAATDFFSVTRTPDLFVGVGGVVSNGTYQPTILRSPDGETWTRTILPTDGILRGITVGDGLIVAVGHTTNSSGGLIFTSRDGITWTHIAADVLGMSGVTYGNGTFAAASGNSLARSMNGVDWAFETILPPGDTIRQITFAEGNFFLTTGEGKLWTSTNAVTWIDRTGGLPNPGTFQMYFGAASIGHRVVVGGYPMLISDPFEGAPPLIVQQPTSRIQRTATTYTNQVSADYPASVNYQWLRNSFPIPGATSATLTLQEVSEADSGIYSVVLMGRGASVTSAVASAQFAIPVEITAQPISQAVTPGSTLTLSATAAGTPPLAFRWRRHATTVLFEVVNGNTSFLTVTNVQSAADYTVAVSNLVSVPGQLSQFANITIAPDSDSDGLPDDYEISHGMNPHDPSDALLDSDGDGVNNRDEFIAGSDPTSPDSAPRLSLVSPDAVNSSTRLEFMGAAGRTYTVQYTTRLETGAAWSRLTDIAATSTNGLISIPVTDLSPQGSRFYRLVTPRVP